MPNLRIVLNEWDIQQLLAGNPVSLSGEARPNEIYLDVENIHLERVKSTIETLIKKQKKAEGGGTSMKRRWAKMGMVVAIKRTGRYYSKDGVGNYMRVRAIERFQTQDGKYTIVNGAWREEEIRPLTEREKG